MSFRVRRLVPRNNRGSISVFPGVREVDVLVIGAGQAGLSVGYHLARREFLPLARADENASARTFLMVDANPGPGGAWQHRWDSLTMATVNNIHDLPGMPQEDVDPSARSNQVLPAYFDRFERTFDLRVERPVEVTTVRNEVEGDPRSRLIAETTTGPVRFRVLVNATGTWRRPTVPYYPGFETFAGRMLRTVDYGAASDFDGLDVGVVGGGISAIQFLGELDGHVRQSRWFTRRPINFVEKTPERLAQAEKSVEERVRAGLPTTSVIRATGVVRTPSVIAAEAKGVLRRLPMFARIEPDGVRMPDGTFYHLDVLLWATGFSWDMGHLRPLKLVNDKGGITMDPPMVAGDPRLYLVGFGPSASTVGANRAGGKAARRIVRFLDADDAGELYVPAQRPSRDG